MAKNWKSAIQAALDRSNSTPEVRDLVSVLNRNNSFDLSGILNVEMKSMVRGATACEGLSDIFHSRPLASDDERALWYVFATDAIFAAYNFARIIDSDQFSSIFDKDTRQSAIGIVDKILPNTIKAADAIRHHHNRAFGKSDRSDVSGPPQFIAQWRCQIKVTDRELNSFWYSFRLRRIETMLRAIRLLLEKRSARR